jgi:hypothetical protein
MPHACKLKLLFRDSKVFHLKFVSMRNMMAEFAVANSVQLA